MYTVYWKDRISIRPCKPVPQCLTVASSKSEIDHIFDCGLLGQNLNSYSRENLKSHIVRFYIGQFKIKCNKIFRLNRSIRTSAWRSVDTFAVYLVICLYTKSIILKNVHTAYEFWSIRSAITSTQRKCPLTLIIPRTVRLSKNVACVSYKIHTECPRKSAHILNIFVEKINRARWKVKKVKLCL
jgi:hypothetical protein